MLKKLYNLLKSPIHVPHAWDAADKRPSFRLWCAVVSFCMSVVSIIVMHIYPVQSATWTTIAFFALCMVFYALNKLNKAKIDLNDGEIDLEANEPEKPLDK